MSIIDFIEKSKQIINRKHKKSTSKDPIIGAALGLTVGAVAAALLTPQSGKETREDIASAAKALPGKAKEVLEMAKEKVEEVKEKLHETKIKHEEQ